MNRRGFIAGLLATTALPVLPKAQAMQMFGEVGTYEDMLIVDDPLVHVADSKWFYWDLAKAMYPYLPPKAGGYLDEFVAQYLATHPLSVDPLIVRSRFADSPA